MSCNLQRTIHIKEEMYFSFKKILKKRKRKERGYYLFQLRKKNPKTLNPNPNLKN
jgi:hypothetical protein